MFDLLSRRSGSTPGAPSPDPIVTRRMPALGPTLVARFGPFLLLNLLGKGAMATVYRAQVESGEGQTRDVALKCISRRLTRDETGVKALVNEARLGARLRHRGVVRTFAFQRIGRTYYIATEFVDGWSLDVIVQHCAMYADALPASVVFDIIDQVADGLDHAHEATDRRGNPLGIVHRDLKPSNLLVSRRGEVKLGDFGIAQADVHSFKTTGVGMTKGTPAYMSPEQVRGDPLDPRSDLFSLGSMMFELVMDGELPFAAPELLGIMRRISSADLGEGRDRFAQRCPELLPVLDKLLAPAAEDRFQSALELRRALTVVRGMLDGPNLAEWLEPRLAQLPEARGVGYWGDEGPPEGAESVEWKPDEQLPRPPPPTPPPPGAGLDDSSLMASAAEAPTTEPIRPTSPVVSRPSAPGSSVPGGFLPGGSVPGRSAPGRPSPVLSRPGSPVPPRRSHPAQPPPARQSHPAQAPPALGQASAQPVGYGGASVEITLPSAKRPPERPAAPVGPGAKRRRLEGSRAGAPAPARQPPARPTPGASTLLWVALALAAAATVLGAAWRFLGL